jgi:hypothetical protein
MSKASRPPLKRQEPITRIVALSCEYPLEIRVSNSSGGGTGDSLIIVKDLAPANKAKEAKYLRLDLKWNVDALQHTISTHPLGHLLK